MRKTLVLLTILTFTQLKAQPLIQWEAEITVADGSQYGNLRPRATIVGNDTPVVIFGKASTTENLFISRWNGSSFDTPISILPTGTSSYIADWTGPDIDASGNTVIATFKLEPLEGGHVYSVRSTDGGLTFSDTIRTDNHLNGVAWMPSMAIDGMGNPVVTYMAHDGVWSNPRYVVVHSMDGGLSYTPEIEAASQVPGEACDCCPAEIAVNGSKEVLLFRNNESNVRDMYGVLSLDGGSTFSSFANVDSLGWTLNACPSTGADAVFSGENLLTTYASAASGKYRVYISSTLTTDSLLLEERMQVPEPEPANGIQNYPRISSAGDTTVMAWSENSGGNYEIFCSLALPGQDPLTGLTSFKQLSNATSTGIQTNPEIIYKNGIVHLFYQDKSSGNLIYRRGSVIAELGIPELSQAVHIAPNPSTTGRFILPAESTKIHVTDMSGQAISFSTEMTGDACIMQMNEQTAGVYLLKFEHDGRLNTTRLMIVR